MLYDGKKVLVLGFSLTGKKSAEYFVKNGAKVYISEYKEQLEKDKAEVQKLQNLGVKLEFGGHSDEFIQNADFAIISPSIKDDAPVLKKINCPIYSDLEFVGKNLNYKDKMVLITGTNGKTTTTMLTSFVLSKKFNAPYVGNVGVPPLEVIEKNPDYLVVEASSYQLHYSKNLNPYISILCNITPDHIAWHNGIEGYIKDKTDILKRADKNSYVILNYDDPYTKTFASEISANLYYFSLNKIDYENLCYLENGSIYFKDEKIVDTSEINLEGNHNYQNVMCAIIASKILGLDNETIKNAVKEFKAPSHRLEFIKKIGKTSYYNDSKATNPEASNVAINSFPNKKVALIAGGRDKNTPLDEFVGYIKKSIEKVVLIGEATERFKKALLNVGFNNIKEEKTLELAIDEAAKDNPDVVLFSPACASFDMFDNFEARGEAFREYVEKKWTAV